MRDTNRYPITLDEMIDAVDRASADATAKLREPNQPVGGIHAMALQEAAKRLRRLQFAAEDGRPSLQDSEV